MASPHHLIPFDRISELLRRCPRFIPISPGRRNVVVWRQAPPVQHVEEQCEEQEDTRDVLGQNPLRYASPRVIHEVEEAARVASEERLNRRADSECPAGEVFQLTVPPWRPSQEPDYHGATLPEDVQQDHTSIADEEENMTEDEYEALVIRYEERRAEMARLRRIRDEEEARDDPTRAQPSLAESSVIDFETSTASLTTVEDTVTLPAETARVHRHVETDGNLAEDQSTLAEGVITDIQASTALLTIVDDTVSTLPETFRVQPLVVEINENPPEARSAISIDPATYAQSHSASTRGPLSSQTLPVEHTAHPEQPSPFVRIVLRPPPRSPLPHAHPPPPSDYSQSFVQVSDLEPGTRLPNSPHRVNASLRRRIDAMSQWDSVLGRRLRQRMRPVEQAREVTGSHTLQVHSRHTEQSGASRQSSSMQDTRATAIHDLSLLPFHNQSADLVPLLHAPTVWNDLAQIAREMGLSPEEQAQYDQLVRLYCGNLQDMQPIYHLISYSYNVWQSFRRYLIECGNLQRALAVLLMPYAPGHPEPHARFRRVQYAVHRAWIRFDQVPQPPEGQEIVDVHDSDELPELPELQDAEDDENAEEAGGNQTEEVQQSSPAASSLQRRHASLPQMRQRRAPLPPLQQRCASLPQDQNETAFQRGLTHSRPYLTAHPDRQQNHQDVLTSFREILTALLLDANEFRRLLAVVRSRSTTATQFEMAQMAHLAVSLPRRCNSFRRELIEYTAAGGFVNPPPVPTIQTDGLPQARQRGFNNFTRCFRLIVRVVTLGLTEYNLRISGSCAQSYERVRSEEAEVSARARPAHYADRPLMDEDNLSDDVDVGSFSEGYGPSAPTTPTLQTLHARAIDERRTYTAEQMRQVSEISPDPPMLPPRPQSSQGNQ